MATALDVIRIEWCGNFLGADFCTGFYYRLVGGTGLTSVTPTEFMEGHRDLFMSTLVDDVSDELTWTEIKYQNLSETDEFGVLPVSISGTRNTDPAPVFVALGLKKGVSTKLTRPGSVRFPGIMEADITGGVWSNTNVSNAFISVVESNFTVTLPDKDWDAVPVVVGRNAAGEYDLLRINTITSVGNPRVTTQNSRKR